MNWILTIILCVAVVELVLRLPFVHFLESLGSCINRVMLILQVKAVSDHWKEKAMGAYARRTFVASAKMTGLLAAAFGSVLLIVMAMNYLSPSFQAFILSWVGVGVSTAIACVYLLARRAVSRG